MLEGTLRALLLAGVVFVASTPSTLGQSSKEQLQLAARAFHAMPLGVRYDVQQYLIIAGHSDIVAIDTMGRHLFASVLSFQAQNGFAQDGILPPSQLARLQQVATPLLASWNLERITHHKTGTPLWIPSGRSMRASIDGGTMKFSYNGIHISFMSLPEAITDARHLIRTVISEKSTILYEATKPDFFAIGSKTDVSERYSRFHRNGSGTIGFTLLYRTEDRDSNRLAIVMSDLFRATMSGQERAPPSPVETSSLRHPSTLPASQSMPTASLPTATPPPPIAPAKEATKRKVEESTGTGFYVSAEGHVLTNEHVVEQCSKISLVTPAGDHISARRIATDPTNDLALLMAAEKPKVHASIRIGARIGEPAYAFGFPLAGVLSSGGNFTVGGITAASGMLDDTRMLQISTPVQPGNSGGPLLDQSGNVTGVVVAKLNALKVAEILKDIPQNINFALKASLAVSFLDAKGVTPTLATSTATVSPPDVAERARSFTVMIECRN